VNVLVQNHFTDADPTMLLSELGLSEPEVTSPLEMSFAARAAEYQRLCKRFDVFWRDRDTRRADKSPSDPARSADARSNGALTVVALAIEAGVPRNALIQRHTDLTDEPAPESVIHPAYQESGSALSWRAPRDRTRRRRRSRSPGAIRARTPGS
jgi:hypothetical protein